MSPFPADPDARKRLQDAQRAEADALKAVEVATRARDRVQRKLDTATGELNTARRELVSVSGVTRAALLLAMDEAELRRSSRPPVSRARHGRELGGDPTPEQ